MKIAIIGAGLSGITAANTLQTELGDAADITIFEKSRGAGGRMSTRRVDGFEFDHGAQYFTVKDARFNSAVEQAVSRGHMARWDGTAKYLKNGTLEDDTGGARYVATPRMNSWIKSMASGLNINTSTRISSLSRNDDQTWRLTFEDGSSEGDYDVVIAAIPAPQAEAVLAPVGFSEISAIRETVMDPCFAVMAGFDKTLDIPWQTLRQEDGPASWIAVNSAKPARPESGTTLMIHAGPKWSEAHVDGDKAELTADILADVSSLLGIDFSKARYVTIHRWLYAAVSKGTGQDCLFDPGKNLIACGDWCPGGRVEGAYLSGLAAAQHVIALARNV